MIFFKNKTRRVVSKSIKPLSDKDLDKVIQDTEHSIITFVKLVDGGAVELEFAEDGSQLPEGHPGYFFYHPYDMKQPEDYYND